MKHEYGRPVIEISDDESGTSEDGLRSKATSKRRLSDDDVSPKVQLTDDSDGPLVKPKKRKTKRKSAGKGGKTSEDGRSNLTKDEIDLGGIPDYLQERRRAFDANKKLYHESALMLPPDYSDIDFEETRRLGDLKERPEFDTGSGVKPCRAYKDIELPQSAGFIPASIAQYLRDYQISGVEFLHRKFVYQEGGILGDDMGLGKTVQVAAFLTAAFGKTGDERDDKRMREVRYHPGRWYPRILIICPGSLIMNWRNELNRWGWWHIDIYHGANKDDILGTARAGLLEVMITTYDTYKNNRSAINMVTWDAVVADECHRLKDSYSQTTKALKEVNSLCRIGLTGTAIQNKYEELWALLDWTNPGHFGPRAEWMQTISKPLAVGQSHEATVAQLSLARKTAKKLVQNLLPRYFLRRMKTLIADQLPKKTDRVVFCQLSELQQEAYETFLGSERIEYVRTATDACVHGNKKGWCCRKHLPDGTPWPAVVFPSMIVLQKLANHLALLAPSTTDLDEKHERELRMLKTCMPHTWKPLYEQRDQITSLVNPEFCGKWKVLKKLLKFWHQNGDKVLVFSHSVRLLRILQHLFTNTSYSVSYLDGSLSYEERQDVVDTFNSDATQFVFLISTKAGGVGLNITSANKVVVMDPHWNPSWDLQAQDRAYRIGQTRDVEVFRLISVGTVEEIVYARQIYKQQQANIGYTASSERRYFRGVQQDTERKGEIFGLKNIFTYHTDMGLLRDIVNKTNIAEAKAGVHLADVDMGQAAQDGEALSLVKKEDADAEDGGMSQLATLLTAENQQKLLASKKASAPKSDAVQAILTSVGIEYTHDNLEVIGTSKVEEQLSRQAAMRSYGDGDADGQNPLFSGSQEGKTGKNGGLPFSTYRPPEEVCRRQFCSMAQEFGFANATDFALVVESLSGEARRNCLDLFYRRRENSLQPPSEGQRTEQEPAENASQASVVKRDEAIQKDDAESKGLPPRRLKADEEDGKVAEFADLKTETFKDEDSKGKDVKSETPGRQHIKDDASLKGEARIGELDLRLMRGEDKESKRSSIFILDEDDDDDEL